MTDIVEQPRDTQAELRAAKEAVAGPVPLIGEAPDDSFRLPRGVFHNGMWQQDAKVRELTGADEEALAKLGEQIEFFGTVIALGVESIGDLDLASLPLPERKYHLSGLLLGERDQLFVKVAQVTFGDHKELMFACTVCGEQQTMSLILSEDLKPQPIDTEPLASQLHHFTTNKGDVIEYRAATGADQDEALSRKGATNAEQNSVILSRCITKVNNQLLADPMGYVRKLGIRDRQQLLEELVKLQPSIDMTLQTKCAACGGDQVVALGWGDIFRP